VQSLLCQENEVCLWHVSDVAASGSAYDDMEEMRMEDEPELLAKVAHRGDVTDLLVSNGHIAITSDHSFPWNVEF